MTKTIKLGLYPTRYPKTFNDQTILEAFTEKEIAFEMEIIDETSIHRCILSREQILKLKESIDASLDSYDKFMGLGND